MSEAPYFAPCPRGLEQALADELRALGAQIDATIAAGVAFSGDRALGYRANLHSRIASRVLLRVAQARYHGDDDLYRLARRTEWERWFDPRHTLRVDLSAIRSPLRSLNFATLRVKDGIVDRARETSGDRPSIDTANPQVRVFGSLVERKVDLYVDLSGEPLFKRGWRAAREDHGEAPLKENLAAGLLALCGWTPQAPLYDPFCGSGTIVIEAAQRALAVAPGLSRAFGFERLLDFDAALWEQVRGDAVRTASAGVAGAAPRIAASDNDPDALAQLRANAQRAGVAHAGLNLRVVDAARATAPFDEPGVIVTNPPYGERIEIAPAGHAGDAWRAIGENLRERFGGWSVWVLSGDTQLPAALAMKPRRRMPLFNGAIECRLFGFEVFGSDRPRSPRGARSRA
ncbi:MAG: class I SAM-dependent RNA methyltransferase [Burkholderiaceae bacterium]|nr:class I SAM-dependent RNA methyltransferase [Burkholderiaceae bacterium]